MVALSLAVAIAGGYVGFGLATRLGSDRRHAQRLLLAGAAASLALSIWTMHFIGMLAAPIPPDARYLVLQTIISFLICALVVGVSLFFVSIGRPSDLRIASSAFLLGAGVVSMHYVGIHGLIGDFSIEHDRWAIVLAILIAVGTAYGGLRIFLARQMGMRLAFSAVTFGVAVSGMHYTAMSGMHFAAEMQGGHVIEGLTASRDALSLVVAVLCFVIAASFLLLLVPEPRSIAVAADAERTSTSASDLSLRGDTLPRRGAVAGGQGLPEDTSERPASAPTARLPVTGADGIHFIEIGNVRSIKADAHYTLVHDGSRERPCPWSISEAEARLDPTEFVRVHRSYIVSIPHVVLIRKEGDGAVVELAGPSRHLAPVSRAKLAELKARLGLSRRSTPAIHTAQP